MAPFNEAGNKGEQPLGERKAGDGEFSLGKVECEVLVSYPNGDRRCPGST